MLFSSVPFLFYFLPTVLLVYFLVPKRAKNGVLLLSSLVFYGWGEPRYLPVMLVSILQGYIFGRLIERFRDTRRAKLFLVLSVLLSLGTLAYFKYADFMIANLNALTGLSAPLLRLALPVGISFYTFQILSYTVDVYRGTVPAQRNFIDLAAYIAMFPQLIAGPIVRYSDIAVQLKTREHSVSEAASGARRFILGLAKKILLANLLGELVSSFRASADLSVLYYWLGAIAFTCRSTMISLATATWPSALAGFSASGFRRTSSTPICPAASRNSGGAGIFRSARGSAIISISRLAETGRGAPGSC